MSLTIFNKTDYQESDTDLFLVSISRYDSEEASSYIDQIRTFRKFSDAKSSFNASIDVCNAFENEATIYLHRQYPSGDDIKTTMIYSSFEARSAFADWDDWDSHEVLCFWEFENQENLFGEPTETLEDDEEPLAAAPDQEYMTVQDTLQDIPVEITHQGAPIHTGFIIDTATATITFKPTNFTYNLNTVHEDEPNF